MARLREDQLNQIRDVRKEQIMKAALRVFARRGILGTKMSMIAEEAGMSHGLVYHYFKSKDELFVALVQEALTASMQAIDSVNEIPGTPIEKLKTLTTYILDDTGRPYFLLIHQARTSEHVPEEARQLIKQYAMDSFIERLLPLFQAGQALGEITEGNPGELIASYLSILSGLMVLNASGEGEYRIPRVELLIRVLQKRS